MKENTQTGTSPEFITRVWKFADCELDELRHELRVRGSQVDLESKPLDLLLQLVLHAGEVVTKEELLETVWNGASVVEGSLATAISKLRKAIGDGDPPIIVTIPRVGYRMAVPVFCKKTYLPPAENPQLRAGECVPGRDQWRLARKLGSSEVSTVWLAQHVKTEEIRVFKFAFNGARLKALKRESTVSRYLSETLGPRRDFVRILEWNFEAAPFYLEIEYGGPNFIEWAETSGGLSRIPIDTRLKLMAEVAQTVASAHSVGVLHKDLKPANILIEPSQGGSLSARVVDFGIASLLEPSRLAALNITNLGFTESNDPESTSRAGTVLYLAPEVLLGHSPTASADVYALGVILYQLAVGDFRRPLSPGWEAEVEDSLVREDISAAACGDPDRRLKSAAELAERLRTLEQRRLVARKAAAERDRVIAAERKLEKAKERRPWIILAAAALVLGCVASLYLFHRAARERDHATREAAASTAMNRFLVEDLLSQSDPFLSGPSNKSFIDVVNDASSHIDLQFNRQPAVAAQLHWTVAKSLDSRFDLGGARREYEHAARLFKTAQGALSEDAVLVHLQEAAMEAGSKQPGSVERAKTLLRDAKASMLKLNPVRQDLPVWGLMVAGLIAMQENDPRLARKNLAAASQQATAARLIDEKTRLRIQSTLGYTCVHEGDGAQAEAVFRALIPQYSRLDGPNSASVLRLHMRLAQALLVERKFTEAIQETKSIYPAVARMLGDDHEITLQVLSTQAASEGYLGRWGEAARDDLAVYRSSVRVRGPAAFLSIASLSDAALSQCRAGRYKEGEENARKAETTAAKAFGPKAGITGGAAYSLSMCLIGVDKLKEAQELLNNIDVQAVTQVSADSRAGADIALALGQIAFKEGRYSDVQKYIDAAKPALESPAATADDRQSLQELESDLAKKQRAAK